MAISPNPTTKSLRSREACGDVSITQNLFLYRGSLLVACVLSMYTLAADHFLCTSGGDCIPLTFVASVWDSSSTAAKFATISALVATILAPIVNTVHLSCTLDTCRRQKWHFMSSIALCGMCTALTLVALSGSESPKVSAGAACAIAATVVWGVACVWTLQLTPPNETMPRPTVADDLEEAAPSEVQERQEESQDVESTRCFNALMMMIFLCLLGYGIAVLMMFGRNPEGEVQPTASITVWCIMALVLGYGYAWRCVRTQLDESSLRRNFCIALVALVLVGAVGMNVFGHLVYHYKCRVEEDSGSVIC